MSASVTVRSGQVVLIEAEASAVTNVANGGPGVVYYKASNNPTSSDTALAVGDNVNLTSSRWFTSAGVSSLTIGFSGETAAVDPVVPSDESRLTALEIPTVPRTQFQFVAENGGDDSYSGLGWGSAKLSIEAAVDDLPDGGIVFIAPGSYTPASTINLRGHQLIGGAMGTAGVAGSTTVNHAFNGNLFNFQSGGGLSGLYLSSGGAYTGAAIAATSPADGGSDPRIGQIWLDRIIISADALGHGFVRALDLDGSLDATAGGPGLRSVFATRCQFFGCRTAGETIRLNRVVHAFFTACEIIQAPETGTTQGLKVRHTDSQDIYWTGKILGNVDSTSSGLDFVGQITGTITLNAGSDYNVFRGDVWRSTFTNNGGANSWREPNPANRTDWVPVQNFLGGVGGDSGNSRLKLSAGGGAGLAGLAEVFDRLSVMNGTFGSFIDPGAGAAYVEKGVLMGERTDPSAPAADRAFLYTRDNGSGKTQLVVRFPTGAVQIVATEP